jgi:hypothetical protein
MPRCNCTLPYRHVIRTRIVWSAVLVYLATFAIGFVIGRILGQPLPASFVLGLLLDTGVAQLYIERGASRDHDWSRSGSWRF